MSAELAELDALACGCPVADRRWFAEQRARLHARQAGGLPIARELTSARQRLDASLAEVARRGAIPLTLTYPDELPVSGKRDEVSAALRARGCLVLTGETGSGKTTQLPKMLLAAGYGRRGLIALTQPRRVAAIALARRIAEECQAPEGAIVHSVRFDDRATADTLVRVMTDGLLLAEVARDRDLTRYDALILDEAHERGLNTDVLLGLCVQLRRRRPDLALVVASASIAAERFAAYLGDGGAPAPVVAAQGRAFPVELRWRAPGDDDEQGRDGGYLGLAVETVREVHRGLGGLGGAVTRSNSKQPGEDGKMASVPGSPGCTGDILCFLPTERDILDASRRLKDEPGLTVLPLFSRLTPQEQQRVFHPARGRKVVLATNIAETSLTIPGIGVVVDTGLARMKRYQPSTRTERLPIEAVSQASCVQRAGRAGRTGPGVCIRLYAEEDFAAREPFTQPELLRANLAGVVVQCLDLGVGEPEAFPWLDAPAPGAWHQARRLLDELGAIESVDGQTRLTRMGRQLAALPADPAVARILLAGIDEGVPHEACTIAAFLSVQDPRVRPPGKEAAADAGQRPFQHEAGDLASVLRLWDRYQAQPSNSARSRFCEQAFLGFRRMREWADVRHQLWGVLRERRDLAARLPAQGHAAEAWPLDRVHRSVLAGMLGNVLMWDRTQRAWRGAGERLLQLHPGSALRAGEREGKERRDGKEGKEGSGGREGRDGTSGAVAPHRARVLDWVVACEVVDTGRVYARMCAPIDPEWVVQLAGDRVKRSHADAHWDDQRRQVVCRETVTWKGLPVRAGRLIPYDRIDPIDATRVFIRQALCSAASADAEGDDAGLDRDFPVLRRNRGVLDQVRGLRDRLRDGTLFVDHSWMESFYAERLLPGSPPSDRAQVGGPADRWAGGGASGAVASGSPTAQVGPSDRLTGGSAEPRPIASADSLRRFIREHGEDRLALSAGDLIDPALVARADADFPGAIVISNRRLDLRWRFLPGDEADGASVHLVESQLAGLDLGRLAWGVPGWLAGVAEAAVKALPKDLRRALHPTAEAAAVIATTLRTRFGVGSLDLALREAIATRAGVALSQVPPLDTSVAPDCLRLRVVVRGEDGGEIHAGRDLGTLAGQVGTLGDPLASLCTAYATPPLSGWDDACAALPRAVALHGVSGHLALARARDASGQVAAQVAVHASAEAAVAWHEDGLLALIEAALACELEALATMPAAGALPARVEAAFGSRLGGLRRQLVWAEVRDLDAVRCVDAASFSAHLVRARETIALTTRRGDALLDRLATQLDALRRRLRTGARSLAEAGAQRLVVTGLDRVVGPGWSAALPWSTIQRLDQVVAGWTGLIDGAVRLPAEVQRRGERLAALAERWEEVLDADGERLAPALGLACALRNARGAFEECCAAIASGASGGAHEAALRLRLVDIDKRFAKERSADAALRAELRDARLLSQRLPQPAAGRWQADLDRLIACHPDYGLGADLIAQRQQARALIERLRWLVQRR